MRKVFSSQFHNFKLCTDFPYAETSSNFVSPTLVWRKPEKVSASQGGYYASASDGWKSEVKLQTISVLHIVLSMNAGSSTCHTLPYWKIMMKSSQGFGTYNSFRKNLCYVIV